MVAFMHTGTRLTAGYRYTTLGDATLDLRMSLCYIPRQAILVAAPFYRKEENDKLACRRRNKNNPWE